MTFCWEVAKKKNGIATGRWRTIRCRRTRWSTIGCYRNFQDLDFKHRGLLFRQIVKNLTILSSFQRKYAMIINEWERWAWWYKPSHCTSHYGVAHVWASWCDKARGGIMVPGSLSSNPYAFGNLFKLVDIICYHAGALWYIYNRVYMFFTWSIAWKDLAFNTLINNNRESDKISTESNLASRILSDRGLCGRNILELVLGAVLGISLCLRETIH